MSITVEFFGPPGQTLRLDVYPYDSDTRANGAGDNATEGTNRKGLYTATITEALSGWHTAHIVSTAGWELPLGDVRLADGETCRVRDSECWVRRILESQRSIDQTTTPWQLVLKDRDTDAELFRFDLQDENGDDIGAIDTFVAEQITPP